MATRRGARKRPVEPGIGNPWLRPRARPIMESMDREQLADFLRHRREALRPEDVGLPRSPRRRTSGLRREEVARLASMSPDYYTRLEQQRGPQPSPSMLAAVARALRLTLAERNHLYRLAGHTPPPSDVRSDYVSPGMRRVLDRVDAPAMVTNDLGEVLAQNPLAVGRHPEDPRGRTLAERLRQASPEFARLWADHDVSWRPGSEPKTFHHPQVGRLELECQTLSADSESQILLIYTASPGTESAERLRLLGVVGGQKFADAPAWDHPAPRG
jgi:transcriptional regulator with XRE-family HTH domain